jgi:branched-chain amino acid transport system substrate-binding protein
MSKLGLSTSLCMALTLAISSVLSGRAQFSNEIIKIGVMADMNGPLSTAGGRGSVEAARMAAEEFGGSIADKPIEIVSADHQNKPDIGAAIARQWFNVEHVDVITDLASSAVGFAVVEVAKPLNKILLVTGPGSSDFTERRARPPAFTGHGTPTGRQPLPRGPSSVPTQTPGSS